MRHLALVVAFCAQVVVTQLLWLTFSPVTEETARALGVGSGAVGDLTAVNPLLFVLLALPAGRWLDRRLVPTLVAGAVLTLAGAAVRAAAPDSFATILTGQVVLSLGQPLLLGASTAVAVRYARPESRTPAIAAVSASQFVGILTAALLAGPLFSAVGLEGTLRVQALIAVVVGVAVVVLLVAVPPLDVPAYAEQPPDRTDDPATPLWRDPFLVALAVLLFVGVGVFNAVATWLDTVLTDLGHPGVAGELIAMTTVAGILGSVVLPTWAARRARRRAVLVAAAVVTVVGFALAAARRGLWSLVVVLALVGFLLLPGLPVALEWAEARLGARRAARTTSALLLAGNAGGVVLVLVVQVFVSRPGTALLSVAVLSLPAVVAAWTLPTREALPGHETPPT